jgi:transcription initiation factor TFIID subunit 12
MQGTSQAMAINPLNQLNSTGALPSQSVSPMVRTPMQSTSTQLMPISTLNPLNLTGALPSQSVPVTSHMQISNPENPERPIVAKRKIQELVEQIDPRERLEPEVEDLLLDIADEFITSVASFACRLAKHRKSDTLEVKDLQLHLERNWNIRIPGFASDEIRSVRKPVIAAAHQQKLAAVNSARQSSSH